MILFTVHLISQIVLRIHCLQMIILCFYVQMVKQSIQLNHFSFGTVLTRQNPSYDNLMSEGIQLPNANLNVSKIRTFAVLFLTEWVTCAPIIAPTPNPSALTPYPSNDPSTHPTILTTHPSTHPTTLTTLPSTDPSNDPSTHPTILTTHPSTHPTTLTTLPSTYPSNDPSTHPSPLTTNNPTNNPSVSLFPTSSPTTAPTLTPSKSPTKNPTSLPTYNPTSSPSQSPTHNPTNNPSQAPTHNPTNNPTYNPTFSPSQAPTHNPTNNPTSSPSPSPTRSPTNPSESPTTAPSTSPSTPSEAPSSAPSTPPTESPSSAPTDPTYNPSSSPSQPPTVPPSESPTNSPSISPTNAPTTPPTFAPSSNPTNAPSAHPTRRPTNAPTRHPVSIDDFAKKPIEIHYELWHLTTKNKARIENNHHNISNDIKLKLDHIYVQWSEVLVMAGIEADKLQYRQFMITVITQVDTHTTNDIRKNMSLTLPMEIYYQSESVRNTIAFISGTKAFIDHDEHGLRTWFRQKLKNDKIGLSVQVIDEDDPESTSSFDYVLYGLLSFMTVMTLLSILAFINNERAESKIDDCTWSVFFVVGLHYFDFVSDLNLGVEMMRKFGTDQANMLLYIAGLGSIAFVIVPYIINLAMASKIKTIVSGNDAAVIYFERNVVLFITLVVFSGSVYPVLALLSSRVFGLDAFNSGLTTFELRQLSSLKLFGSVLAENVPQTICQILYWIYLDSVPTQNTILSMV
eukprot:670452_1